MARPRLKTIPSRLAGAPSRLQPSSASSHALRRISGSRWQKVRERIMARDQGLCQQCKADGRVSLGSIVDHRVALFQGGSDDDGNLWLLCIACDKAKKRREDQERLG